MTEHEEARLVREFPELEHFTDMIEEWQKTLNGISGAHFDLSMSVRILKAAYKTLGITK